MGLGTDDGRNGRSGRHGPGEIPPAQRAEARNENRARPGRPDARSSCPKPKMASSPTIASPRSKSSKKARKPLAGTSAIRLPAAIPADSSAASAWPCRCTMPDASAIRKVKAAMTGSPAERIGPGGGGGGGADVYSAFVEIDPEGHAVLHYAQPDSGTNHGTSMSIQIGEILGFTSLDHMRVIWGDSDLAPSAPGWNSGLTTQLQGGALCNAADKMRKELLQRAADTLKVDVTKLQVRDGVISSTDDAKKKITFVELVKANNGPIRMEGKCTHPGVDRPSDEPRHRRLLRRSRSRHLDWRLPLRPRFLRARCRQYQ